MIEETIDKDKKDSKKEFLMEEGFKKIFLLIFKNDK